MKFNKYFIYGLAALAAVLALESFTDLDILIQNKLYNSTRQEWNINPLQHKQLTIFFYDGLKRFLMFFAACCLLNILLSVKKISLRRYNHFCLTMLLSFAFVPAIVAGAKCFTNVYCPYQLDIYNGAYPFVRILESYPADFIQTKTGKCFPAGHATAGFAFMGLFYAFNKRAYRIAGLMVGLIMGWTAGIYQMFRGQHFLSHTLFSMIACFMVIMIVAACEKKIEQRFPQLIKSSK